MRSRSWVSPRLLYALRYLVFLSILFVPTLAFADVESSLTGIQAELTNFILPTLSVIGLGIASVSFFTGNPQAKQHIVYAILGCCFGFGAQAITGLISRIVH